MVPRRRGVRRVGDLRDLAWLAVSLPVFVLAMGSLTVFELISGKSVASAVGNSTGATFNLTNVGLPTAVTVSAVEG